MDRSPLTRLPAEIRLDIYQHVFTIDGDLHLKAYERYRHQPPGPKWRWSISQKLDSFLDVPLPKHTLALTRTCRQLRVESWPICFSVNKWTITPCHVEGLRDWLDGLRKEDVESFREVEVRFSPCDAARCWEVCGGGHPSALAREIYRHYYLVAGCFDTTRTQLKLVIEGLEKADLWKEAYEGLMQKHGEALTWPEFEVHHEDLERKNILRVRLQFVKAAGHRLVNHTFSEAEQSTSDKGVLAHNLVRILATQIRLIEALVAATGDYNKEAEEYTGWELSRIWRELAAT